MKTMTMTEIVEKIVADGGAKNNEELEVQFEFFATEDNWTDQEIQEALSSPWFPWFRDLPKP